MNPIFEVEIQAEACCDICDETVHNHFDCPTCGKTFAATDAYVEIEIGDNFSCESCRATFKRVEWDKIQLVAGQKHRGCGGRFETM